MVILLSILRQKNLNACLEHKNLTTLSNVQQKVPGFSHYVIVAQGNRNLGVFRCNSETIGSLCYSKLRGNWSECITRLKIGESVAAVL